MPILETATVGLSGKSISYLLTALGLATAGAVDTVNVAFNHQSMLAETGLPFESQIGLAALFLAGFVFVAFKFLNSQDEKFKILSDVINKQDLKIKELESELKEINDENRTRINNSLDGHK